MSVPRAKDLFVAALDLPVKDRASFLAHACGADAALRRDVESLLAFHDEETQEAATPTGDAASPSFAAGDVFAGRYRMIARIGRGGMGDVWRADDLVLKIEVALKVIHALSQQGRASVLNEVRLARQVTHPAVCRVFDVGETSGRVFYTMELVHGEDLAALLRRVGRLPSEKVADVARQLCGGLAAAHGQGSCTATSSRPMCSSTITGACGSRTSASPSPAPTREGRPSSVRRATWRPSS